MRMKKIECMHGTLPKNNNVNFRMETVFKDAGYKGDYYWFIP